MDEHLIQQFFNKNCSPEEAEQVIRFLAKNPRVLEKYLDENDWNNTEPIQMDEGFWDEIWDAIRRQRRTRRVLTLRLSAAAAVLLLIVAGTFLFDNNREKPVLITTSGNNAAEYMQRVRINNTDKPVSISLPDSSGVLLSPGSVIVYHEPFSSTQRNIQLEGKGRFKVVKDAERPFTVYAGGLATTALGTEFTINTNNEITHTISVQLHTGKVVVKQAGQVANAWAEDIYLDPGQQLNYDAQKMIANVGPIRDPAPVVTARNPKNRKAPRAAAGDQLEFVNTPLPRVLTQLEKHFGARIVYDSADVAGMNFTGKISKNDALEIVLKVIAQMNELNLVQEDQNFELKKIPEEDKIPIE